MDDALDKLRWAERHFETLQGQIGPFEERDSHTFSYKVDPKKGEYTFHVHDLEAITDPDWGLMVGDCLHNARTALDYVAVRLMARATFATPESVTVQFPISDKSDGFKSSPAVTKMRKEDRCSGYLTRIEELQPFNLGNPSIWGTKSPLSPGATSLYPEAIQHALPIALSRLSRLDNLDKHRIVHATWLGARHGWGEEDLLPFVPDGFESRGGSGHGGPLEDGAEIGSLRFKTPLPYDWKPDHLYMKSQFPLHVAIYNESGFSEGVLEVLRLCLWGVKAVLEIFEPVFEHPSKPPLPVTAIKNDPGATFMPFVIPST